MREYASTRFSRTTGLILLYLLCGTASAVEHEFAGWSLQIDNDALALSEKDQDYSFGFGLTLAGGHARSGWYSLDPLLGRTNNLTGWQAASGSRYHSIQIGLMGFTPSDIETEQPLPGEHPYANLLYYANAREQVHEDGRTVDYASLSLGLLGSAAGEATQKLIHDATNDDKPRGWDNQISDGGEPTFRYLVARQTLRKRGQLAGQAFEIKRTLRASVGYLTEAGLAYSMRFGHILSPWWRHAPENVDYLPGPGYAGINDPQARDFFAFGGVMLRLRGYNAVLQGQFRDSAVEYAHDELRHLLGEAWLGVTRHVYQGLQMSFTLRYKTREIRDGRDQDDPLWGSITLSHGF